MFLLLACTGIGGFTFQFFDYAFYNAVLRDFMQYSWPIAYQEAGPDNIPMALVIYCAYYIVPAAIGKLLGWGAAYFATYLWSALGLLLIVFWFQRILGSTRLLFVFMLLFFGGMDIWGRLFSEGGPQAAGVSWWDYLTGVFWWSETRGWLDHWSSGYALTDPLYAPKAGGVFFRFYSPLSFLVDGPHHVLPGMVGFMMLVHDFWRRQTSERALFIWASLPLCSVFIAAGSVPFLVLGLIENRCKNLLSFANVAAIPLVLMFLLYFSSAVGGRVNGFIWEFQNLGDTYWMLLLHYLVEFGLLALLIPVFRRPGVMPGPLWYLGALTMFLLAPFYRMGEYNDFATKIIIPAQFIFILILAISFTSVQTTSQRVRRAAAVVVLLIGAIGPLGVVIRAFEFGMTGSPPPYNRVRHINAIEPRVLAMQGKGDTDAFFWKHLAKAPVYRPTEPIYPNLKWNFRELKEPLSYWIFFTPPEKYALTDKGLRIETQGNQPILRRNAMGLDANTVGMIDIKADISVDGEPATNAAVVAIWATKEQVASAESTWPFQRWHTNQAWPVLRIVSTNSYWRGTIEDMAFYLRVPKGDNRTYEVTISEIAFLER